MISFELLYEAYLITRNNNKKSRDVIEFEMNLEENLVQLFNDINFRNLELNENYTFIVEEPKPREIFATRMKARILHHILDIKLRPIVEQLLSENTFNNRKGKGLFKAIEKVKNDIKELSNNYSKDSNTWIFHFDFKGFFPNADITIAEHQQQEIIDKYYVENDKEDIKYILHCCLWCDPARHCKKTGDIYLWNKIPKEKSLFNKPIGTGGAIGFLCWQNSMQLYPNDVLKWLESFKEFRITLFVDDLYIITNFKNKLLNLIPILRQKLKDIKIYLNESKFYCQHYSKGIMCLR